MEGDLTENRLEWQPLALFPLCRSSLDLSRIFETLCFNWKQIYQEIKGQVEDAVIALGKVEDVTKVQTLLFSATLPDWVNKLKWSEDKLSFLVAEAASSPTTSQAARTKPSRRWYGDSEA